MRRPGASVFHLRGLLPHLDVQTDWIVLLEDHTIPDPHWLPRLKAALADQPAEVDIVVGSVVNRTSTGAWSWAAFLYTLAFNWVPAAAPPPVLTANAALRPDLLRQAPLRLGQFERVVLGAQTRVVAGAPGAVVDHVQHRTALTATLAHWHNARTLGAAMRLHEVRAMPAVRAFRRMTRRRHGAILRRLGRHPMAAALPRGTPRRLRWLGRVNRWGFLWGALFGAGRSPYRLD